MGETPAGARVQSGHLRPPLVIDYQVVLMGNYAPARQQSMLRFAEMLQNGWRRRGVPAFLVQPEPWAARRVPGKMQKWAAYVDQYLRFPARAARAGRSARLGRGAPDGVPYLRPFKLDLPAGPPGTAGGADLP